MSGDTAFVRRDQDMLGILVTRRGDLVNYASAIVGDRGLAEDIVQDAYFRLKRFGTGQASGDLDEPVGYLYRTIRNLAIDGRRRQRRERALFVMDGTAGSDNIAENKPGPEDEVAARDDLRLLQDIMAELPERARIALEMHRFGGCKFTEIAERLDVSVGTAHALVVDALEQCKTRLSGTGRK
ncbi:RNA polymerase sigma factor [Tepidicaulis sp. LMO-SS28]|uniref:RNA polymerase sigma factor n=1 Tax=Tepidicaulis sp. LMO-SS28 TaxID=3447455 RepID=UPI003EE0C7CD